MRLNKKRLGKEFYAQSTTELAPKLLGKVLVRASDNQQILRGVIVEVEAYLSQNDSACHSFRGERTSNASMFQEAGTLYVYPIHSRHCMNVVTENVGVGAAVLIRAIDPLEGLKSMAKLRFDNGAKTPKDTSKTALTRGPGRLCQALDVDRRLDGISLLTSDLCWIEEPSPTVAGRNWKTGRSVRIGISSAQTRKLRWFIDGNLFVSGCARDHTQGRNWTFGDADD